MADLLADKIDQLLPQTQCELCDYPGCRPYAEAIAHEGESIDRCLPGGVRVLQELGELLGQDVSERLSQMQAKQKGPTIAKIRESECIGCTKCIQACPVDAILGASKQMHVVLTDACNGCELCVPPCPVDCIDLLPLPSRTDVEERQLAMQSRALFEKRKARLERDREHALKQHRQAKLADNQQTVTARQQAIREALARVKNKKGGQDES